MSTLVFRKPELSDIPAIKTALGYIRHNSCDYSAANIYLWSDEYGTEIAFDRDDLYIKYRFDNDIYFAFPFVKKHIKNGIENMKEYAERHNIDFKMGIIEPEMYEIIDKLYPDEYMIYYNRDSADYIYNVSDLTDLSGKKYHGKKNHINKFKKTHSNWNYEKLSDKNAEECIEMVKAWCVENKCFSDEGKSGELCVMIKAIKHHKILGLKGGIIRADNRVVAVTLGEEISSEMFVVHFEKAFSNVQGAYPMINQQFVINELMNYKYVNREEDMGVEGLRKAKESYNPVYMGKKGILVPKSEYKAESIESEEEKQ